MNYLPDAANSGAEIYCEARVSHVERAGSRWRVHFDWVGSGRKAFDAPSLSVTADIVVIGAGALGSTEILLRSRDRGLRLSSQTGKRFTGNGDFLAFAYNADQSVNGMGFGLRRPDNVGPVGPCITGLIDLREVGNFRDGFVIEEGSVPSPLAPILTLPLAVAADTLGRPTDAQLGNVPQRLARKTESDFSHQVQLPRYRRYIWWITAPKGIGQHAFIAIRRSKPEVQDLEKIAMLASLIDVKAIALFTHPQAVCMLVGGLGYVWLKLHRQYRRSASTEKLIEPSL